MSVVAAGLLEGALAVHHARAGLLAQGGDVLGADLGSRAHAFCSWVAFSGAGSAAGAARGRARARGGLGRAGSGRSLRGRGGPALGAAGASAGGAGAGAAPEPGLGAAGASRPEPGPRRPEPAPRGRSLGRLLRGALGLGLRRRGGGGLRGLGVAAGLLLGLAARALLGLAADALLLLGALGGEGQAPVAGGLADRVGDDGARLDRVVVAGDDEVDPVGVAVGVDQADDRDAQALGLADGDQLGLEVDDEHRVGRALHVLHAAEVGAQLGEVGLGGHALARRQQRELALGLVALEVVQAPDALVDGLEVRQQAAEPAVVDVRHAGGLGDVLDGVAGLLLGADEEHDAAALGELAGELARLLEQALRLQQVDDVDAAALAVDEAAHLGVPAARLVAEMYAGLQQLPDPDFGHGCGSLDEVRVGDVPAGARRTRAHGPGRVAALRSRGVEGRCHLDCTQELRYACVRSIAGRSSLPLPPVVRPASCSGGGGHGRGRPAALSTAVAMPDLASSFDDVAAAYERGRRATSAHAIAAIAAAAGGGPRLLDVGAGTGRLSGPLLEQGFDVVAVEPLDAMREILAALHRAPSARWPAAPRRCRSPTRASTAPSAATPGTGSTAPAPPTSSRASSGPAAAWWCASRTRAGTAATTRPTGGWTSLVVHAALPKSDHPYLHGLAPARRPRGPPGLRGDPAARRALRAPAPTATASSRTGRRCPSSPRSRTLSARRSSTELDAMLARRGVDEVEIPYRAELWITRRRPAPAPPEIRRAAAS